MSLNSPITAILSRNNLPIIAGVTLQVQRCVGRYGQTDIVEGVVQSVDTTYKAVVLKLTKPAHQYFRDHRTLLGIGAELYVPLPVRVDYERNALVCQNEHQDFEHGHETWADVLETANNV